MFASVIVVRNGSPTQQLRRHAGEAQGENQRRQVHRHSEGDGGASERHAAKVPGAAVGRERGDRRRAGAAEQERHEKQVREDRLIELLRKRKTLRHYLSVCRKRNNQMLAKTMAIEQLEINAMQLQAIKSTAEAFESFSRKTGGVENIEGAADKLSEHMETLARTSTAS